MTSLDDAAETEYERVTEGLGDLGVVVTHLIGELLSDASVPVHSIEPRVKKRASAMRKLGKSGSQSRNLSQLTDLLGVRVITYLRDEVDVVAKIIERNFAIDRENSVDKRAILDPDRFGYLSLHYIASLSPDRLALGEYRRFTGKVFEIQVRSILQHAWAEIEHDLGYKSERAIPESSRRRFSRLAGLLEVADDEFVGIRDDLARHREAAEAVISAGTGEAALDQDSVFALIRTSDIIRACDLTIVHAAVGEDRRPGEVEVDYAGSRATELQAMGMRHTGEVLDLLSQAQVELIDFARRWLQDDYPGADARPDEDESLFAWDEADQWPAAENRPSRPSAPSNLAYESGGLTFGRDEGRLDELAWPAGVSLFYLYLRARAEAALRLFGQAQSWPEAVPMVNRALAACLAEARGESSVPLY